MSEQEYDKEQLRILRNAFKAFDHDERGYIEHADVSTILEILGQKLDDKATKALIKEVDKGNSGKLDFSQFCRLAARFVEVEEDANALASELKEAFRVYDKEGKGYLTVATLRSILHELDDKISNQDLDSIIEEIDADGSGTVDFDEFMQVMTGKNYYDLSLQRRFVFEPPRQAGSVTIITPESKCPCPSHRMRLHRRIESYFERWFEQMWHPLPLPLQHHHHSTTSSHRLAVRSGGSANQPSGTAKFRTIASTSATHATTGNVNATTLTTITATSSPQAPPPPPSPPVVKSTRIVRKSTLATPTGSCCYRSVFRPRFPKWVPILTLYRELVQNPFRQRARYMITHN